MCDDSVVLHFLNIRLNLWRKEINSHSLTANELNCSGLAEPTLLQEMGNGEEQEKGTHNTQIFDATAEIKILTFNGILQYSLSKGTSKTNRRRSCCSIEGRKWL